MFEDFEYVLHKYSKLLQENAAYSNSEIILRLGATVHAVQY